jgi:membrane-bound inhibitor of C-type lysozyme
MARTENPGRSSIALVITYGDEQAIIFPQVSASGARYGRTGIQFWEHHGSATVDFYGIKLACTPVP